MACRVSCLYPRFKARCDWVRLWSILAQASATLTPGKLDLPFGFSRYSVAGCRTVSPGAHRLQYVAIAHWPATPQYERAMHTSVRADDEADLSP
jgi:hypothetical protein